jgi:hypothetical protein
MSLACGIVLLCLGISGIGLRKRDLGSLFNRGILFDLLSFMQLYAWAGP